MILLRALKSGDVKIKNSPPLPPQKRIFDSPFKSLYQLLRVKKKKQYISCGIFEREISNPTHQIHIIFRDIWCHLQPSWYPSHFDEVNINSITTLTEHLIKSSVPCL